MVLNGKSEAGTGAEGGANGAHGGEKGSRSGTWTKSRTSPRVQKQPEWGLIAATSPNQAEVRIELDKVHTSVDSIP